MTTIGARGCDVTDVSLHEEVLGSLTRYKHLAITLDIMGRQGAYGYQLSDLVLNQRDGKFWYKNPLLIA